MSESTQSVRTKSWPDPAVLFARHLDLTPLGGRRRGLVVCPFHEDRSPSLSVDLDLGIFHCFGCNAGGGVRRFAELVGELPAASATPGHLWESDLQRARRRVMQQAQRGQARRAEWTPFLFAMRWLCTTERLVDTVRDWATNHGPDDATAWEALSNAAVLETFVAARDAEIEAVFVSGRVA